MTSPHPVVLTLALKCQIINSQLYNLYCVPLSVQDTRPVSCFFIFVTRYFCKGEFRK